MIIIHEIRVESRGKNLHSQDQSSCGHFSQVHKPGGFSGHPEIMHYYYPVRFPGNPGTIFSSRLVMNNGGGIPMKNPRALPVVPILVWVLILAGSPAFPSPDLTAVRKTARDGYIFLYPLVMNYRLMYIQAIDKSSPSFSGGFGTWVHHGPASSGFRGYTSPGIDTLYSSTWVDLRAEPWVLTVPPSGNGRYVVSQWDDLWGYVLDNPGVILDGEGGGKYLLAPPGWKGTPPKGIKRVITGESPFLGTLARTEVLSPADLPAAKVFREGFELRRLSTFLGREQPAPAQEVDWPAWKEGNEKTPDFFGYACFLLPFVTEHPKDRDMKQRLARIGVSPGAPWKPGNKGLNFQKALQDGISDARDDISRAASRTVWSNRLYSNRQTLGDDYLSRCVGAYLHLFGNVPSQTLYLFTFRDSSGEPLDGGKHSYTLTLPAGGAPGDRFFWSLTAYTLPERGLVPGNPDHCALGTHSLKLHKGGDGSITLLVQKNSPGKDKELNWLPVPSGPFFLVARACGPTQDTIFHTWKQPPLKKEK
jgi:hypothetical protein